MKTSELQGLTVKELQKFATDLGSTESSGLLKQELIKEIFEDEFNKKSYSLKNLSDGKQKELSLKEVIKLLSA